MIEVVIHRKNGRQRKPEIRGNRPTRGGEQGVDVVDGGEALSLRHLSNVLLQGSSYNTKHDAFVTFLATLLFCYNSHRQILHCAVSGLTRSVLFTTLVPSPAVCRKEVGRPKGECS